MTNPLATLSRKNWRDVAGDVAAIILPVSLLVAAFVVVALVTSWGGRL